MGDVKFGFQHTPGHTPEHLAITLFDTSRSADTPWVMFSCDFLFVGDMGRVHCRIVPQAKRLRRGEQHHRRDVCLDAADLPLVK